MKRYFGSKRGRSVTTLVVVAAGLSLVVAACGGSGNKSEQQWARS